MTTFTLLTFGADVLPCIRCGDNADVIRTCGDAGSFAWCRVCHNLCKAPEEPTYEEIAASVMPPFEREELIQLRERAEGLVRLGCFVSGWERAHLALADAADHLDAMLARCTVGAAAKD